MNDKLQDLLNSIQRTAATAGDVASDAAYGVGKKASALLSTAKLNIRVCELRADLNTAFREVGEMLYATHSGNPTNSGALLEKLEEIDAIKAQIDDLNAQLGKAAQDGTCPVCGAAARSGDVFCRECGSPLKRKEETPAAAPVQAPAAGAAAPETPVTEAVTPADVEESPVVTAADVVQDTDTDVSDVKAPVTPADFAD